MNIYSILWTIFLHETILIIIFFYIFTYCSEKKLLTQDRAIFDIFSLVFNQFSVYIRQKHNQVCIFFLRSNTT